MSASSDIPSPTVRRLSLYLRELEEAAAEGRKTISSTALARTLGSTDAQVRRDLGCLGVAGKAGVGYQVKPLMAQMRRALSLDRSWRAAIVGVGKIGRALLGYARFAGRGFDFVAAFDDDPELEGTEIGGLPVQSMEHLEAIIRHLEVDIAVLAIPGDDAEEVAHALVRAGVRGILNFAPRPLQVSVPVERVDLSSALEHLAFTIENG